MVKKILANIFLILYSASIIIQGVLFGQIIDSLFLKDIDTTKLLLVKMFTIIVIGMISGIVAWKIIYSITKTNIASLRKGIFRFDLNVDNSFELTDYTTNVDIFYQKILISKWNIVSTMYLLIFSIFAMGRISIILMLVGFASSCLPLLIPVLCGKKLSNRTESYAELSNKYQSYVNDRLCGKQEIARYFIKMPVITEHSKMVDELEKSRQEMKTYGYITHIVSSSLGSLSFFIIIATGALLVSIGLMSAGSVISVVELMNYTIDPIEIISDMVKEIKGAEAIKRKLVNKKENSIKEVDTGNINDTPLKIEMKGVSFSYNKCEEVIADFNYIFEPGKKYLIKGESGIGKSTLAKLIIGDIIPQNGKIEIDGIPIEQLNEKRYEMIRIVNQDEVFFMMSLADNIRFYREVDEDQVNAVIEAVNLSYLNLANGYDDNISGGEKERLAIARALINLPGVLILDEPTAALDKSNTKKIMELICSLNKTIICISHESDIELTKMFDSVIEL